jgi:GAF domain-containing protein
MADQMAIAVGNARLFDDSQRRITELAVVNEISRALTATSDLGQLFVTIHEQVGRLFEASNFYIATYDGGDEWSLDYQIEHSELQPTAKHKLGRGVTSHILRTKQSLLMRSVQDYLAVHEMYDIPKIGEPAKSWMGVPLIVAGNVTGVMGIQSYDQEWLYSEQNVALFSTIGTQVAAAIQNARLLQEARVRANELASLNELSRTLASQLSVQQVLEEVWHGVSHLLDTTNFYIALYDAERQEISFPINASESVLDKEITVMPASQGLTGHLIRTRQPLLVKEEVQHAVEQLGLENVGAVSQSYLGVPIAIGDQVLGAIAIQSYTTARVYNEHDQDLLVAIAGQTAIALQNARLFEQTKRQASEAAALSEIMRDISQRVDLEFVLETAYRHIRQLLPTDVFLVALLEGERQLRYPLIYDEGQRFPSRGGEVRPETNIGRVILEGKSLLVIRTPEELDAEAGSMAVSVLGNTQRPSASLLYVPLTAEQKTVGALSIQSYELNAYSPDNVVLMERIASQVAIAIQNALLFEETSQRNAELATLNQITSSASQTLDLRALLDMVLTQTLKDFGFDGGLVTVYNETRHKLERVVRTGLPGRIPDDPAEGLENSLCAYVFNSQEPLVIEDFRQGGPIDVSGEVEAGYLSYIGIPLEAKGRTLGTWCGFRKSPGAFGKNTLTLLQTVGHQVGFAIENAQFFAQTQATLAETEQLYAASQRLTAATTLQEAVAAMAEGVPVTDINRAALWLFERDEQGQVAAAIVSAGWYSGQGVPVMPTGTRLSSEVIKAMPLILTTEPLFSGDLKTDRRIDPSTAALLQQQRIGAIAILPLWATGRHIGAFLLEAEGSHTFTDAEIRPYTSLAQQLATTIYNQQLLEQTQRNTQQLTILNELGRDLSQEIELDSVLNATFRNLQRLLPLDAYLVGLCEGDTDVITYPVVYDDGQWYEPTTGSLSSPTTTTQVIITGKPVLKLLTAEELADQSEVAGAMGDVNRPSASLLYAPLQIGPRTIGVLSVQSYQLNAYTSEHVQIVGSVASQVAAAIQNARLFEQIQRTARREQTLRELTARVRSSSDPDTIVRTAVRELSLALGRQTFIRLGDAAQLTTPPAPPAAVPVSDNGSGMEAEGRKVRTGGQ